MSQFIVHSVPGSPFGRAVLTTLEEKSVSYRLAPVESGTLRVEPHASRHPFGRVPVLEHDGFLLYETQAILRYLDRVIPNPELTPPDIRAAARMDQVLNICDWYLFQGVCNVIGFQRIVAPKLLGMPTDEAAISACMPKAQTVFQELSRLLGDNRYFAGNEISLADILAASHIDFLTVTPEWEPLVARFPNIVAWLERMNSRPSMKATTWERVAALAEAA